MRKEIQRLTDILDAIHAIERYSIHGQDTFFSEELIQTWIAHHIQIIGEAAASMPSHFRQEHPEIPWREMIGMRNVLVHRYFGIDRKAIWNVVQHDLPALKKSIGLLLNNDPPSQ